MYFVKAWLLPFAAVLAVSLLAAWIAGAGLLAVLMVLGSGMAVFAWCVPGGDRGSVLRCACTRVVIQSLLSRSLILLLLVALVTLICLPMETERGKYSGIFHSTVILWVSGVTTAWGLLQIRQSQSSWTKITASAIGALALVYCLWLTAASPLSYMGAFRNGTYNWNGWAYVWWLLVVASASGLFYIAVATAKIEYARKEAVYRAATAQIEQLRHRVTHQDGGQLMAPSPNKDYVPKHGTPINQPTQAQPVRQIPPAPVVAKLEVPAFAIQQIPEHLFGQDRAVAAWAELLAQYLPYYQAGVVTRPLAVIHVGPRGVGKHHFVELLAKGPLRGVKVYLIDVPESGVIDPEILAAIAEGGESFRRTVFIACVNVQDGAISDLLDSHDEVTQDQLIECLSARIDKQTLRRFTRILPFAVLEPTACAQIAGCYLVELADRNGIVIERLDPQFLYRCAKLATASVMATGARAIQLEVPKLLGDGLERCKLHRAAVVEIAMTDDDMVELRITATLS